MMTLSSVCSLSTTFLLLGSASGFVGPSGVAQQQQQHMNNNIRTTAAASQQRHKQTSKLFIEKWVADMIDEELWRENHKEDYERAWMEKNRAAVLQSFGMNNDNMMMRDDSEAIEYRQLLRDKKLARENPQQYCADRCIATGYCDVYEDIFDFSPEQVIEFCNDCVLSEAEEPCEIPDAFYDLDQLLKP